MGLDLAVQKGDLDAFKLNAGRYRAPIQRFAENIIEKSR
jgi:hypothetical protein